MDLPLEAKTIGNKLIFERKLKLEGSIKKHEAQMAIEGYK